MTTVQEALKEDDRVTEVELTPGMEALLKFHEEYQPLITRKGYNLKVEYNLINGKIDAELDQCIRNYFESFPGAFWKWYAQGVNLITSRRDICFKESPVCKLREY